jgi:hypothetical protein
MVPSSDFKARLTAELAREPAPTRAALGQRTRVMQGLVAVVLAIEFFSAPAHGILLGQRPVAWVVATSLAWVVSLAALLYGLRSRGSLGPPAIVLWGLALGSIALPYAVGLVGNLVYPATAIAVSGRPGFICLELSIAWSTLPLTAWVFVRQGSDPVHPVALGAAFGAVAACLSGLLVGLVCPFSDPAHIALGHVLPGLIEVGVGALMGQLLIAVRTQRAPRRTGAVLGAALGGWLTTLLVNLNIQRTVCPTYIEPQQVLWLALGLAGGGVVGALVAAGRARRG